MTKPFELLAVYIYEKKADDGRHAWAKWEKHVAIDSVVASKLWSEPIDLDEPKFYNTGDYCFLCSQNDPCTPLGDEVDTMTCKDCFVLGEYFDVDSNYFTMFMTAIGHIKGRPICFYYRERDDDPEILIDDAISRLNTIETKLGFERTDRVNSYHVRKRLREEEMAKAEKLKNEPRPPQRPAEPLPLISWDADGRIVPPVQGPKQDFFIVRLYDQFDGWINVSSELTKDEADARWRELTDNGTKNARYDHGDYYAVFPAGTRMLHTPEFRGR